jgi:hypothetical protein
MNLTVASAVAIGVGAPSPQPDRAQAVERQTLVALGVSESDQPPRPSLEWMSYTALLIQIDRIVEDLSTPCLAERRRRPLPPETSRPTPGGALTRPS